jgi:hypothetical protein
MAYYPETLDIIRATVGSAVNDMHSGWDEGAIQSGRCNCVLGHFNGWLESKRIGADSRFVSGEAIRMFQNKSGKFRKDDMRPCSNIAYARSSEADASVESARQLWCSFRATFGRSADVRTDDYALYAAFVAFLQSTFQRASPTSRDNLGDLVTATAKGTGRVVLFATSTLETAGYKSGKRLHPGADREVGESRATDFEVDGAIIGMGVSLRKQGIEFADSRMGQAGRMSVR